MVWLVIEMAFYNKAMSQRVNMLHIVNRDKFAFVDARAIEQRR